MGWIDWGWGWGEGDDGFHSASLSSSVSVSQFTTWEAPFVNIIFKGLDFKGMIGQIAGHKNGLRTHSYWEAGQVQISNPLILWLSSGEQFHFGS